ncbi:MAG: hypothetical protein ACKOTF_03110, partial [Opitutaceae bacterium]
YTGPAVLLAADAHAERLLPGNPASRAVDLSVWQEERIATVRNRQREEISDLRSDESRPRARGISSSPMRSSGEAWKSPRS